MTISIHNRIRILLEQTSDAFSSCGAVNADFADFASLVLADFSDLLDRPGMTDEQLQTMLRLAMMQCRDKAQGSSSWASFMAHHLAQAANSNRNRWSDLPAAAETAGA